MMELASRGHDVTVVSPFPESKPIPNYTEIEVKTDFAAITGGNGKKENWKSLCNLRINKPY
jgi:hypothetical protein